MCSLRELTVSSKLKLFILLEIGSLNIFVLCVLSKRVLFLKNLHSQETLSEIKVRGLEEVKPSICESVTFLNLSS